MLIVRTFPAGDFMANCIVLGDVPSKQALVVDPGGDPEQVAEILAQDDLAVAAIVLTHGHIDHVLATREVKDAHGGPVCIHPADRPLYEGARQQAMLFGLHPQDVPPIDRELADGDEIAFGKSVARVVHTPGHSPGSVCLAVADEGRTLLLSGDTLFRRGVGRTDLMGGDTRALERSLRMLYGRFPDARVIPGHGPATTIAEEAHLNPFVRAR